MNFEFLARNFFNRPFYILLTKIKTNIYHVFGTMLSVSHELSQISNITPNLSSIAIILYNRFLAQVII